MLRDRVFFIEPFNVGPPSSLVVPLASLGPSARSSGPRCSIVRGIHCLYRLALDTVHVIMIHGYSGGLVPYDPFTPRAIAFLFSLVALATM